MLGFLPTRAYRPGTPGATTFLSPLSGTFNYGWDSFRWPALRVKDHWSFHFALHFNLSPYRESTPNANIAAS